MKCEGFPGLMKWQSNQAARHMADHKYFESEKAGRDVGSPAAEKSFTENFLPSLALDWRIEYCGRICPHLAVCELGAQMIQTAEAALTK